MVPTMPLLMGHPVAMVEAASDVFASEENDVKH